MSIRVDVSNAKLKQRASTAEKVATALSRREFTKAAAEAELSGTPVQTMALATLIMQHRYGLKAAQDAMKQVAVIA
jgi:hypothetical protein